VWLCCLPEGAICNLFTGQLHLLVTTPSYPFVATGVVPGDLGVVACSSYTDRFKSFSRLALLIDILSSLYIYTFIPLYIYTYMQIYIYTYKHPFINLINHICM